MIDEQVPSKLTRYTLVGLFSGIIALMLNFLFDIIFRTITGFSYFQVVNVSTIIFGSVLPVTIGGVLLYFFEKVKGGMFLYIICFSAITAALIYLEAGSHMFQKALLQTEFHELFGGLILILGVFTAWIVPFLSRNSKLTAQVI
ncbi:MAG: hypothetical protein ABJB11_11800 [Ferruginibacter sp.]